MLDGLILWAGDKNKPTLSQRLSSREIRRNESLVQCFLFSNHLVTTTRGSNGKLHLVKVHPTPHIFFRQFPPFNIGLWRYSIS